MLDCFAEVSDNWCKLASSYHFTCTFLHVFLSVYVSGAMGVPDCTKIIQLRQYCNTVDLVPNLRWGLVKPLMDEAKMLFDILAGISDVT